MNSCVSLQTVQSSPCFKLPTSFPAREHVKFLAPATPTKPTSIPASTEAIGHFQPRIRDQRPRITLKVGKLVDLRRTGHPLFYTRLSSSRPRPVFINKLAEVIAACAARPRVLRGLGPGNGPEDGLRRSLYHSSRLRSAASLLYSQPAVVTVRASDTSSGPGCSPIAAIKSLLSTSSLQVTYANHV